jgi:long-chain acyl-CoA synthetase
VLEAAVFGVPDETTGEAIVAQVVVRAGDAADPGALRGQLVAHLAAHLAAYKAPAHWHIGADALPRNPAGKLLKSTLRAHWLQQAAARAPGVSR